MVHFGRVFCVQRKFRRRRAISFAGVILFLTCTMTDDHVLCATETFLYKQSTKDEGGSKAISFVFVNRNWIIWVQINANIIYDRKVFRYKVLIENNLPKRRKLCKENCSQAMKKSYLPEPRWNLQFIHETTSTSARKIVSFVRSIKNISRSSRRATDKMQ